MKYENHAYMIHSRIKWQEGLAVVRDCINVDGELDVRDCQPFPASHGTPTLKDSVNAANRAIYNMIEGKSDHEN